MVFIAPGSQIGLQDSQAASNQNSLGPAKAPSPTLTQSQKSGLVGGSTSSSPSSIIDALAGTAPKPQLPPQQPKPQTETEANSYTLYNFGPEGQYLVPEGTTGSFAPYKVSQGPGPSSPGQIVLNTSSGYTYSSTPSGMQISRIGAVSRQPTAELPPGAAAQPAPAQQPNSGAPFLDYGQFGNNAHVSISPTNPDSFTVTENLDVQGQTVPIAVTGTFGAGVSTPEQRQSYAVDQAYGTALANYMQIQNAATSSPAGTQTSVSLNSQTGAGTISQSAPQSIGYLAQEVVAGGAPLPRASAVGSSTPIAVQTPAYTLGGSTASMYSPTAMGYTPSVPISTAPGGITLRQLSNPANLPQEIAAQFLNYPASIANAIKSGYYNPVTASEAQTAYENQLSQISGNPNLPAELNLVFGVPEVAASFVGTPTAALPYLAGGAGIGAALSVPYTYFTQSAPTAANYLLNAGNAAEIGSAIGGLYGSFIQPAVSALPAAVRFPATLGANLGLTNALSLLQQGKAAPLTSDLLAAGLTLPQALAPVPVEPTQDVGTLPKITQVSVPEGTPNALNLVLQKAGLEPYDISQLPADQQADFQNARTITVVQRPVFANAADAALGKITYQTYVYPSEVAGALVDGTSITTQNAQNSPLYSLQRTSPFSSISDYLSGKQTLTPQGDITLPTTVGRARAIPNPPLLTSEEGTPSPFLESGTPLLSGPSAEQTRFQGATYSANPTSFGTPSYELTDVQSRVYGTSRPATYYSPTGTPYQIIETYGIGTQGGSSNPAYLFRSATPNPVPPEIPQPSPDAATASPGPTASTAIRLPSPSLLLNPPSSTTYPLMNIQQPIAVPPSLPTTAVPTSASSQPYYSISSSPSGTSTVQIFRTMPQQPAQSLNPLSEMLNPLGTSRVIAEPQEALSGRTRIQIPEITSPEFGNIDRVTIPLRTSDVISNPNEIRNAFTPLIKTESAQPPRNIPFPPLESFANPQSLETALAFPQVQAQSSVQPSLQQSATEELTAAEPATSTPQSLLEFPPNRNRLLAIPAKPTGSQSPNPLILKTPRTVSYGVYQPDIDIFGGNPGELGSGILLGITPRPAQLTQEQIEALRRRNILAAA